MRHYANDAKIKWYQTRIQSRDRRHLQSSIKAENRIEDENHAARFSASQQVIHVHFV